MHVTIHLLGGFALSVDGSTVPDDAWQRRQATALAKLLSLQPGRRLRREQVIDALWPEALIDEAAPRLHKAAHYARRALGPGSVVLTGDTVTLFPAATVTVDVELFDRAAEAARSDEGPDSAIRAIDLYRGDLLPDDLYEPWTEDERDRRRLRYLELLRDVGRWGEILAADPTDEEAHLRVVQGHVEAGNRSAALRQLEVMETVLRRELGEEPSTDAVALRADVVAMPAEDASWEPRTARIPTPVRPPPTRTIGREHDVEQVLALLARSRIVTLLGPGGVGKTRLAVEAALSRSRATSVQTCFVDLTKVGEPRLVAELIGREIGISVPDARSAERTLEEALRGRALLLVLDNFEHVIDAAGIVGRLARWSDDVEVLTTSRARLQVAGEQVLDVAPLPVDVPPVTGDDDHLAPSPAEALFEQVATAVDPAFRLGPVRADVQAICRQVDGLPLAIELAAGHVRTLPPALLGPRLAVALSSPTGATRETPPRQRTMAATIEWSLALLDPSERLLFERLGVFRSAVPLEAVEQVCSHDLPEAVAVFSRLVDQSLVRRVESSHHEPRFVLLELLRERARSLLDSDTEERDAVLGRHAQWVAHTLDDLDERRWTEVADRWIGAISDLLPEVRAAQTWAVQHGEWSLSARITASLGTYWHREGHHAEGRSWLARALAHQPPAADGTTGWDERLIARLQLTAGFLEWPRDILAARAHWTTAEALFRSRGDDRYVAYSLALMSGTYIADEDGYDFALRLCEHAIALARDVGELPLIAQALNIKGELTRVHGDDTLALAAYEEGQALAAEAGDDAHLSVFLANLAYLAMHRGDAVEARRLGCAALNLCWSLGRRMMAAWTVSELAGPELALGRAERGARLVGAADQALLTLGVTRHPGDRPEHDTVVRALNEALGEEAYQRLRAEGAHVSLDDAVALALSDPPAR